MKKPIKTVLAIVLLSSLVMGTIVACGDQEGDSHESEGADSEFFRVPTPTQYPSSSSSKGDQNRRMRIYRDIAQAELQADEEAMRRVGLSDTARYGRLYEEVKRKSYIRIRKTYGLSQKDMDEIIAEGDTELWPLE